ncbi:hypothetical protein PR202_ga30180 [Eleusine coracana subsp. coracana]|uniref:Uncharacterized protein n=1 Tax=Eleusine coracana subsp. coracana TaxID=191504 RepID=A0AAV5DN27_ELECO|nr:hypothetical protein PR202_ga30180 [Eleusine coracana subsp. coracana]
MSGSPSPLSSIHSPCPTTGRSKAQRWKDCSPPSSDGSTSSGWVSPSYRNVLLTSKGVASPAAQVDEVVVPPPLKIVLKAQPRQTPASIAVDT